MTTEKTDDLKLEHPSAAGTSVPTRIPPTSIRPDERDLPSVSSRNSRSDPPELIAIPGYRYERELQRSKRTIVYKAREEETGREVVNKLFKNQEDFDREKENQHRIINSASDKDNSSNKDYFLLAYRFLDEVKTMIAPYLRGGDLYALPDKVGGILRPRQTWVLTVDLFDALQILHDRLNIIHRDVKSRNVFVDITNPALEKITAATLESYTDLNFKLGDLEFAAQKDLPGQDDEERNIIGTPRYMAPEVCLGEKYDPRSDIYSAVVIIYRLLAGHYPIVPVAGENYLKVIQRQIQEDIPDITNNPYITARQNLILKKGLAKRPEDRYQTAQEFKRDWLDELVKGK